MASLTNKWPMTSRADIEDAVGGAMVDLWDYWVTAPSSIDWSNPGRNFYFAMRRGVWTANSLLIGQFRVNEQELLVLDAETEYHEPDSSPGSIYTPQARMHGAIETWDRERAETPEDIVISQEEIEELESVLADLTQEEIDAWFEDFMEGLSTRAAGEKQGVSNFTISRRRNEGLAAIVDRYKERVA